MEKEWSLLPDTSARAVEFSQRIGTTPFTAALLLHRGITSDEEARAFLHPEKQPFHDPFLMADMETAAARILDAIERHVPIVVYGDYDVDGMTSTTLLTKNIRALGGDVSYYIPNRFTEGYGINLPALRQIHEEGCALLITVDCGIASVEAVAAMRGVLDPALSSCGRYCKEGNRQRR